MLQSSLTHALPDIRVFRKCYEFFSDGLRVSDGRDKSVDAVFDAVWATAVHCGNQRTTCENLLKTIMLDPLAREIEKMLTTDGG